MSLVDAQDPKPSHLTIDLASNNPFRNRAASPASAGALPSPTFSFDNSRTDRPQSKNPFVDNTSTMTSFDTRPQTSPRDMPPQIQESVQPQRGGLMSNYDTLFRNLALDSKPAGNDPTQQPLPPSTQRPINYENKPPLRKAMPSMNGHRPSRSREEEMRRRQAGQAGLRPAPALDIFADPPEVKRSLRPRRNSESSIADKNRMLSPEEERHRQDRRRRDREARRGPDGKLKPPSSSKRGNKQLDIIDKLDVSSIYGTGLFHHDGPFDACRPHRNRKGSTKAPLQAFPKDSINNTLGGAGPVNSSLNLAQFHGRGDEGFTDFSTSGKNNPAVETNSFEPYAGAGAPNRARQSDRPGVDRTSSFNPTARVDPVHGDESLGLGTSTFLEGAPASRTAIQRRESEGEQNNAGGLSRKKSLVQKIRGINRDRERPFRRPMSPQSPGKSGNVRGSTPTSPLRGDDSAVVMSAGGMRRVRENPNTNPFFNGASTNPAHETTTTTTDAANDYDDAYEKKGMRIQIAETEKLNRAREIEQAKASDSAAALRSITSAGTGTGTGIGTIGSAPSLERRVTTDVVPGSTQPPGEKPSGGFLSRVKSLKGGKRARPDKAFG